MDLICKIHGKITIPWRVLNEKRTYICSTCNPPYDKFLCEYTDIHCQYKPNKYR